VVGCWRGYLSGARCRLEVQAQLMPLQLAVSCLSEMQIGFTFLVPAHSGSPGQKGPLNGGVCVWVLNIHHHHYHHRRRISTRS